MIFGQQSSARTALRPSRPQRLICSRRRLYIPATVTVSIMSLEVFIQKFLLIFLTDSTMHSYFCFEIGEESFEYRHQNDGHNLCICTIGAASQAIPDHIFRPTDKAFSKHINDNLHKLRKSIDYKVSLPRMSTPPIWSVPMAGKSKHFLQTSLS